MIYDAEHTQQQHPDHRSQMRLHNQVDDEQYQCNGKRDTHCCFLSGVTAHERFPEEEHDRTEQTHYRQNKEYNHELKIVLCHGSRLLVILN